MMRQNSVSFIDRFAAAFGRPQATLLKFAGLHSPEVHADRHLVFTEDGNEWIDFGSFGLHLLGHKHPKIRRVAVEAVDEMGLSTRILGNLAATELVETLVDAIPWRLDGAILANSGAEAVEAALKMSIISAGRNSVLALEGGYHGRSIAAAALGNVSFSGVMWPPFEVRRVKPNDIDGALSALRSNKYGAFIVEPILGEGGIVEIEPEFLSVVGAACAESGTKFILDEIQTGLGRTGRAWAGGKSAIEPDVLLIGKGLGGGYVPISAAMYKKGEFSREATDPLVHSSSFSGGALAARIASAAVKEATDPVFLTNVRTLAGQAHMRLTRFCEESQHACSFRGYGLMMGLEFESADLAGQILIDAAKHGLLMTFCLSNPKVLRLYPPGVLSPEEMDHAIDRLYAAANTPVRV